MEIKELKLKAKEDIRGKIGKFFLIYLLVIGISMVCAIFEEINIIFFILTVIVNIVIMYGISFIFLKNSKNEEVEVNDLFKGFNNFTPVVMTNLLRNVYLFFWYILLIVPGIVKTYFYAMVNYILVDNQNYLLMKLLLRVVR